MSSPKKERVKNNSTNLYVNYLIEKYEQEISKHKVKSEKESNKENSKEVEPSRTS